MSASDVRAIFCSDLHLCHKPPVWRSAEPNWYAAMERSLNELSREAERHGNVPIICAGDIFNHWNEPAECINFALKYLPNMFAIPGQHDLPLHNIKHIGKSAYWTLVEAGTIHHIDPMHPIEVGDRLVLHGFPWQSPLTSLEERLDGKKPGIGNVHVAVVHHYIWTKKTGYTGAPEASRVGAIREVMKGFDAAVFGDNHKGFLNEQDGFPILNCGGFMRRKSDELHYRPCIGLLLKNGDISRWELDISQDKYMDLQVAVDELIDRSLDMTDLLSDLSKLGEVGLDFVQALVRFMDQSGVGPAIKKIVLEAMEKRDGTS